MRITYKQKNIYLLIGASIFLLICYWLAFSKTFVLLQENHRIERQLKTAQLAPDQIRSLEGRLAKLEHQFGDADKEDRSKQEQIIDIAGAFCESNNLLISQFNEPQFEERTGYTIESNSLEVQGGFTRILQLLYLLEHETRVSNIASVHFERREDRKTKRSRLFATITMQNINKEDS